MEGNAMFNPQWPPKESKSYIINIIYIITTEQNHQYLDHTLYTYTNILSSNTAILTYLYWPGGRYL